MLIIPSFFTISSNYGKIVDFFRFGEVREISAQDYVAEVNKAGDGIFVVLHLYKQGIPLCALINQYLTQLAAKFPTVKVIMHTYFVQI